MKIQRAQQSDVRKIAPLFDDYRVFYKQASDIQAAKAFLTKRIANRESVIFMALCEEQIVGFTQLYTTYSSVSLRPFYILNDLYVLTEFRGKGIGERLLATAKELCKQNNFKGLSLETASDNPAQQLYEKLDWKKDTDYFHYFWKNKT
ncbi:MAG: GNAT family N-acetyltransferase [Bacteroidota bacterium]